MRASPVRSFGLLIAVLTLTACASLQPVVQGQNDLVAWQATDLRLERKTAESRSWWLYSFSLAVSERRGIGVTFHEIETIIYQPGTTSWTGRYRGSWQLDANDQFRIPLQSSLSCHPTGGGMCSGTQVPIPLWRIRMSGVDGRGQPVATVIDLSLPADPPLPPPASASSVREITLVPPKPGQTPAR